MFRGVVCEEEARHDVYTSHHFILLDELLNTNVIYQCLMFRGEAKCSVMPVVGSSGHLEEVILAVDQLRAS
jgi:hypothetical protein